MSDAAYLAARALWRSRKGRALRARVVREEPLCWLRLPGCTEVTTTADHVLTVKQRPDLVLVRANLRGACESCNYKRNDKTLDDLVPDSAEALGFFD